MFIILHKYLNFERCYGPFQTKDAADFWARSRLGASAEEWRIITLYDPQR